MLGEFLLSNPTQKAYAVANPLDLCARYVPDSVLSFSGVEAAGAVSSLCFGIGSECVSTWVWPLLPPFDRFVTITDLHSWEFEGDGRTIVPCFHLVAALYDRSKVDAIEEFLAGAYRCA